MSDQTIVPRELFELMLRAAAMAAKRKKDQEAAEAEKQRAAEERKKFQRDYLKQVIRHVLAEQVGAAAAASLVESLYYYCDLPQFANGGNYAYISVPDGSDIAINVYVDFEKQVYETYGENTFIACDSPVLVDKGATGGPSVRWDKSTYCPRSADFLTAYSYAIENAPLADEVLAAYEEERRQEAEWVNEQAEMYY